MTSRQPTQKPRTRAESEQTGNEPRSPYQQKDARPINTRSQGPIRNGQRTDGNASYYPAHGQNGQKMYNESHCFITSTILETCRVSTIDSITMPKAHRMQPHIQLTLKHQIRRYQLECAKLRRPEMQNNRIPKITANATSASPKRIKRSFKRSIKPAVFNRSDTLTFIVLIICRNKLRNRLLIRLFIT